MKIEELKPKDTVDCLKAKIIDKQTPRKVETRNGRTLEVATATLEDETGTIPFTLWGKNIEEVQVGDMVEIKDAFVNEFQGEPQLTLGKRGSMKVV
ncbi:MAG: SOSS complex subunit B family protein [Methanocellales archaeon]|nr:SOSS complex subunit B family protein [Methanocellales archaeon]MDD4898677.1 SOSS complex subunit B family protein [Methanocellales archaeon]MDD5446946.1 SOSS complex subunit B family protein [Methanocellales archaeon]HIH36820.1 DNA-binding protein [Methanocellales archaeon]